MRSRRPGPRAICGLVVKADRALAAIRAFPAAPLDALTRGGGLVVVAPHPDDESLGCGGAIAQAREAGLAVRIVVVSDGAGSHPNSKTYPPERLRRTREDEARDAAAELGVDADHVTFLRLPDGRVPHEGAAAQAAVAAIADAADAVRAGAVLTSWHGDPHCDHQATFRLCRSAVSRAVCAPRLFSYIVWGWTLPPEADVDVDALRGVRLDIGPQLARKIAAVRRHVSQLTALIDDDLAGFRLSVDDVARFCRPSEWYIEETS